MESTTEPVNGGEPVPAADADVVARLRTGDEATFAELVDSWSPAMLRVARGFVSTPATAEEVVQDTWVAVIRGLDRFEGRSSLRTWVFRILANLARTRAVRESRMLPWSSWRPGQDGPAEDPDSFIPEGEPFGRWWTDDAEPQAWPSTPEAGAVAAEIRHLLSAALADLPERQRVVVTLRDVEGFDSDEVCDLMGLSAANQRVLLHRARVKLRAALNGYVTDQREVPA